MSLDARSSEPNLRRRVLVGAFFPAIASAVCLAAAGQGVASRIDVRVGVAPTPFGGSDGQTHLAYELWNGIEGPK